MSLHILALETSSAWCGVALLSDDGTGSISIANREHHGVQEHSARLLPMIDEILAQTGLKRSSLDAIAFGQGPGGFTGLRVACGVAQGLGLALDRPLLPVVSHAAVAQQVEDSSGRALVVAMDARMHEIYLAIYRRMGPAELETVLAPQLMATDGLGDWVRAEVAHRNAVGQKGGIALCGDAAQAYPEVFAAFDAGERLPVLRPTASAVAELAHGAYLRNEAIAPELAMPLYVRDKVAFTTQERESGAGGNPRVEPREEAR